MRPIDALLERAAKKQTYIYEAHERMITDDTTKQVGEFSDQLNEVINNLVDERAAKGANTPEYFLVVAADHLLARLSELQETETKELV